MKKIFTVVLFVSLFVTLNAQTISVQAPVISPKYSNNTDWAGDAVVIPTEPIGNLSAIQKSDGSIYAAINDTLFTTNLGIVIMKSTNGGISWTNPVGLTYRGKVEKLKLVRSGLDSIYCFFQVGNSIYSWNIEGSFINSAFANGGYRTFDVEATSYGTLHIFVDSLTNNDIRRYLSTTGGYTWTSRSSVTTNGGYPILAKSQSGDTIYMNYRGPILADTLNSIVRIARYRETAMGSFVYVSSSFYDVALEVLPKKEYVTAGNNGEVWVMYTVENNGISEVYARKSSNYGVAFTTTKKIFEGYTANLYGIDLKSKIPAGNGFNFLVYYDSTQTGNPTNLTDKLLFATSLPGDTTIGTFQQISNYPPVYSTAYSPKLIELPYVYNSTGTLWVGVADGQKKVFFDALHAVPVELTSFIASLSNNSVKLEWSTATETNNKGFEIQKSIGNKNNFSTVAFVEGKGTSTVTNNYSYSDKKIENGSVYYRLKQIDFNGEYEYSKIVEVENIHPASCELSQNYPNPFNPSTIINYTIPENGKVKMELYNVLGSKIAVLINDNQEAGRHSYQLNAGSLNLNSGVYFYSIQFGNNKLTKKLMLVK